MSERIELIRRYQQLEADLKHAAENNRPVCEMLSGDLMSLAEKLGCVESAQTFLNELRTKNQPPRGPFSGVTGF